MGVARVVGTGLGMAAAGGLGYYLGQQMDDRPEIAIDTSQQVAAAQPTISRTELVKQRLQMDMRSAIERNDLKALRDAQYQYRVLTQQLQQGGM